MKLFAVMALALAVALPSGVAFAQSGHPGQPRQSEQERQTAPSGQHKFIKKGQPAPAARQQHRAPIVGQRAANSRPYQRAHNSRFAPPPRGQEFRLVNDHLVLVDQKTLNILTVVGLLSALTN